MSGRLRGGVIKCFGDIFFARHPLELFLGLNQSRDLYASDKKGFRSKDALDFFLELLEVEKVAPNVESPLYNTKGISLKYWVLSNISDFQGLQKIF